MAFLKELNFGIKSIGSDNPSISDQEVMEYAVDEGRIIITHDSDYGELIFEHRYKPVGVIYIRIQSAYPEETGETLRNLIGADLPLMNRFTVIDQNGIRQRAILG